MRENRVSEDRRQHDVVREKVTVGRDVYKRLANLERLSGEWFTKRVNDYEL